MGPDEVSPIQLEGVPPSGGVSPTVEFVHPDIVTRRKCNHCPTCTCWEQVVIPIPEGDESIVEVPMGSADFGIKLPGPSKWMWIRVGSDALGQHLDAFCAKKMGGPGRVYLCVHEWQGYPAG